MSEKAKTTPRTLSERLNSNHLIRFIATILAIVSTLAMIGTLVGYVYIVSGSGGLGITFIGFPVLIFLLMVIWVSSHPEKESDD